VLGKRQGQEVVPAKPHGLEIDVEPAAGSAANPLDSIHYFPAVVSELLAARSVLASAFDIRVGAVRIPPGSTVSYQAL
jgi:hypothetical protein